MSLGVAVIPLSQLTVSPNTRCLTAGKGDQQQDTHSPSLIVTEVRRKMKNKLDVMSNIVYLRNLNDWK
ncbi:hypothetical protein E2C01_005679 [Portunus trituberculatus]|uniref:Uncharacterized protein n=1 Tax=Portunus trituberculatus TaxID=210409 RepID=A0A5B7CTC3_PORTR|nr:hypothetical protein [Portunus trituberculatus]